MPSPDAPDLGHKRRAFTVLTVLYGVLIIYGSLYPFTGWRAALEPKFAFLTEPIPSHLSGTDVLTNVVAYLPVGALFVWAFGTRSRLLALSSAFLFGGTLSFSMESVQMFLPSRVSSNVDLLTNLAGTLIGAILGLAFHPSSDFGLWFTRIRDEWFLPGPGSGVALAALGLWILSQLSPFVPSMDVSTVAQALAPMWRSQSAFSLSKLASYATNITGVGLMVAAIGKPGKRVRSAFVLCVALVLLLKPLIVTRELSLETVSGLAAAGLLLLVLPDRKALQALLAMLFICSGFVLAELTPAEASFHSFNWIPFAGEIDNTVSGFGSILEGLWPFVALAALTILGFGAKRKPMLWVGGPLLIAVFGLEWMQQSVPGRYGDITVVILAAFSWIVPWLFVAGREVAVSRGTRQIVNRAADLP